MFLDRQTLRDDLFGLIGFYNPNNPAYPILLPSLLESRSARRVQEVHPLLTIENIDQSKKNFSTFIYPVYNTLQTYSLGQKVSNNGVNFEYINSIPNSGQEPPNTTFWEPINELSDYLIKMVYAGIDQMQDAWINDKKIRFKIKSIYDRLLLFNGVATFRNEVANQNNFVGLRLELKRGEKSLVTILNRIGSQFVGPAFTGLTIYLYHTSQNSPISTYTVSHTQSRTFQWTNLTENNLLRYVSDSHDAGGRFFIGYKQSQLETFGARALDRDVDWRGYSDCGCDDGFYELYKQYSQYVDIVGFEIDEAAMPGDTLFDPDTESISITNTYGLNLDISTKCDIGSFVAQEEDLFAEALNLSVGLKLLQGMASTTRGENTIAEQVSIQAQREILHSTGVYGTVYDRFNAAIKALSFDLSALGEDCFPCDDGNENILGVATLS